MNEIVTAPALAPPAGFAHAVVAGPGRTVYLGGQTAQDPSGAIVGDTMVEQFEQACGNVAAALRAAGGEPSDLVSLVIYVTDLDAYRESLKELGKVHQRHFGRHYPAMALFGVTGLFDPAAMVELVGVAVVA
ncbi:MAG TPA: RidA family protein [Solirubrobacteraceae bacterium]|nr:RidA family protein [Solirubrobacteraceae bacterium]